MAEWSSSGRRTDKRCQSVLERRHGSTHRALTYGEGSDAEGISASVQHNTRLSSERTVERGERWKARCWWSGRLYSDSAVSLSAVHCNLLCRLGVLHRTCAKLLITIRYPMLLRPTCSKGGREGGRRSVHVVCSPLRSSHFAPNRLHAWIHS